MVPNVCYNCLCLLGSVLVKQNYLSWLNKTTFQSILGVSISVRKYRQKIRNVGDPPTMGKISILGHMNYVYSPKYSLSKVIVNAIDCQNALHLHNSLMYEVPWCGVCVLY